MLVSIIIPVYNVSEYLRPCLDSIAAQTYSNIEVILVDDGSTDDSVTICREYVAKDSRFRLIEQKNSGPSAARNTGLRDAHGELITFVDADDWIAPDAIEVCVKQCQKYPEAGVVRFAICEYKPSGEEEIKWAVSTGDRAVPFDEAFELWLRIEAWHGICAVYRRSLIEGMFFMEHEYSEDLEFTIRLFTYKSFETVFIERPLYYYRYNPSGTTYSRTYRMWEDACRHWIQGIERLEESDPKKASQFAYGLFKTLKHLDFEYGRKGMSQEEFARFVEIFRPAFLKLKKTKIDWSVSRSALKERIYWYFPRLWRRINASTWIGPSLREF